ncbi:hypothetical protein U9M48_034391 [Paspalum notatum var. saurae]|uniref:TF-B3 domain-containing protein n=1 Tax=Paspalum notatum var. saurae TaxID=547442 RepID=A0AAQ3UAF4_PASNO
MAAAPAPAPPAADAPAAAANNNNNIVDRNVWLACAVPLSRLPAVGSQVYYFPHGHAEQCPEHLPAPLPTPHLFPCTVTAVTLGADDRTNEVFARISLRPGPHRGPAVPPDPQPPAHQLIPYSTKGLTNSDANNGGGFSVPRYCADHVFPRLDFQNSRTPVQTLRMTDMDGAEWEFRHIYRGTPRRHLLTTGWSTFVNAKLLVFKDKAVFMRRPDGSILIGLRRQPRYRIADMGTSSSSDEPPRNARARVPPQDVMEAARLAAQGDPFAVTYYPRLGAGEFVVPRKEVEDALLQARWEPGTQVRMQVMESEDARRIGWATGTVRAVHQNIWRALQVDWDEPVPPSVPQYNTCVNAWQLQLVAYPPPILPKRPCRIPPPPLQGDASSLSMPAAPPPIIPAAGAAIIGMQGGASHTGLTTQLLFPIPSRRDLIDMPPPLIGDVSSDDPEFSDPEAASASPPTYPPVNVIPPPELLPVQGKSIQLFGTTITSLAVKQLDNGGAPNAGVPDDDAEQEKGA